MGNKKAVFKIYMYPNWRWEAYKCNKILLFLVLVPHSLHSFVFQGVNVHFVVIISLLPVMIVVKYFM